MPPNRHQSRPQDNRRRVLRALAHEKTRPSAFLTCSRFLRALYQEMQAAVAGYSWLTFAEDLGFSATNQIRLVAQGYRRLSVKSAQTIARSLRLGRAEKGYLVARAQYQLRRLPQSKSAALSRGIDHKAASYDEAVQAALFRYFSRWLNPVIREASRRQEFKPDYNWFRTHFYHKVPEAQFKDTIEVLAVLRDSLDHAHPAELQGGPSGGAVQPSDAVATSLTYTHYHEESLECAKEALHLVPDDQRDFNVLTLTLSQQACPARKMPGGLLTWKKLLWHPLS